MKPRTLEERNAFYIALDGVCVGLASAGGAFLSVFIVRLGADAFWVSLLSSLPALVHLFLTLPLSRLVEEQRDIVPFFARSRLFGRSVHLVIGLLPFFLAGKRAAQAIVLFHGVLAMVTTAQMLAFTVVMNRATTRQGRAATMARRWTSLGLAEIVVLALAGQMLERVTFPLNYQLVFLFSFVADLLNYYTILKVKPLDQTLSFAPTQADRSSVGLKAWLAEIVSNKPFLRFILARNTFWLGISMIAPLIPIFWVQHLKASDAWVSYFNTALSAATLLSYGLWVRLKRRRGNRFVLLVSVFARSLYPLLIALTPSAPVMLLVIIYNGIAFAGLNLMFFDAFLDTVPRGREARYIGTNQTITHLVDVVAPPVGALLVPYLGIRGTFVLGTAVALVGFLVFLFGGVARERTEPIPAAEQR